MEQSPDPCTEKVEKLGDKVAREVERAWTAPPEEAVAARDDALVRIGEIVEQETSGGGGGEAGSETPDHPARVDVQAGRPAAR